MPHRFVHRMACGVLVALVSLGAGGACTERQDLEEDTVRVRWSDQRAELDVVSCGLDDNAFVLVADSASGFAQLLLVVEGTDDEDADRPIDIERSAVTVEVDTGVLGAGDASLLGVSAGVPGEITKATIRGDRVDVEADARDLDGVATLTVSIEIAARCSAAEEIAARPDFAR